MEDYFKYDRYYLITKKYIWNIIDDFKSITNSSISKVGICIRNEILISLISENIVIGLFNVTYREEEI